ncbi:MAG: M48 family metallopeptidase [Clostridia bacterium]|nr:M48 family metallopeptidase [Clostridia bacterium]
MRIMTKKINLKITIEETAERHPVPVLGIDYKVKIVYKNVRVPELNVEDKIIKISLPNKYKKENDEKILDMAIDKMYEQIAKVEVERAMEKTRILLGFAPEDYEIKKMKKTFGKCEDKKITINPEVVKYDRNVIDYIVLHQYCHLKYKTHSKGFINMIRKYEPNFEQYEEKLIK